MPAATTLLEASLLAQRNLYERWQQNTLRSRTTVFAELANPIFPDDIENNHPLGDWIAVIAAFAPTIQNYVNTVFANTGLGTTTTYMTAVDYIYRMFKFASELQGAGLITAAQATALLVAYNAQFPVP